MARRKSTAKRTYKPRKKATAPRKPKAKKNARKVFSESQLNQYVHLVNQRRNPNDEEE
tara:strand:+ start:1612 stop:1785 length:174 start_codon:yes stop_codon:yes gene_type:complete